MRAGVWVLKLTQKGTNDEIDTRTKQIVEIGRKRKGKG